MPAGLPSYEIGSPYLSLKIGQSEVLVGLSVVEDQVKMNPLDG